MKSVLLLLLFTTIISYNPDEALKYAMRWWNGRNSQYNDYGGNDCANFVSQCLIAGGLNLNGCAQDNRGTVPSVNNLKSCLTSKGFKAYSSLPRGFRAGYPVIFPGHATLCSRITGSTVFVAAHSNNHDYLNAKYMGSAPTYYM